MTLVIQKYNMYFNGLGDLKGINASQRNASGDSGLLRGR